MTVREVEKSLEVVDQFRQANACIVVPIHKLPGAMESRDATENEVRSLFFSFREQVCKDNNLEPNTPFAKMPDGTIISEKAEERLHALLGCTERRQCRQ